MIINILMLLKTFIYFISQLKNVIKSVQIKRFRIKWFRFNCFKIEFYTANI